MPAFCRHNRFEANCPICSRERAAAAPSPAPRARPAGGARPRPGGGTRPRPSALRTRRLARDADDGYRSELAPGLRARPEAERLARALAAGAERLAFPGPWPALLEAPEAEDALWLACLLALVGPAAPEREAALAAARPRWADGVPADLDPPRARAAEAYRAWAERSGGQAAGLLGDAGWTPERRFARVFDRLSLPGFDRSARFRLLVGVGAAELVALRPAALHLGGDDPTTAGAKRALRSGDLRLLERRAAALADAAELPLGALDRGLADFDAPGPAPDAAGADALARVRAALGL